MANKKISFSEAILRLDSEEYPDEAIMDIEFECHAKDHSSKEITYGMAPFRQIPVTDKKSSATRMLLIWVNPTNQKNITSVSKLSKGDKILIRSPLIPKEGSYARDQWGNRVFWVGHPTEKFNQMNSELILLSSVKETCSVCRHIIKEDEDRIYCPTCQNPFHLPHFAESLKVTGKCPICAAKSSLSEIMKTNVTESFDFSKIITLKSFPFIRRTSKFYLKDNPEIGNYGLFLHQEQEEAKLRSFLKTIRDYLNTRTGARAEIANRVGQNFIIIPYQDTITLDILEKLLIQFERTMKSEN